MKAFLITFLIAVSALITVLTFPVPTMAASNCCLNHGGACGCYCCDRTSLIGGCEAELKACLDSMNTSTVNNSANVLGAASSKKPVDSSASNTDGQQALYWVLALFSISVVGTLFLFSARKRLSKKSTP